MLPARSCLLVPLLAFALSACGNDRNVASSPAAASPDASTDPLPTPAGASGSGVTGMPPAREGVEPPADAPAGDAAPAEVEPAQAPVATGEPLPALPGAGEPAPAAPAEPTVADAVATLRDYYAAINAGDFGRAHALWSDSGRASGQTVEQFAAGFAQTRSVAVDVGPPSRLEAAAGSRYLQLPVTVTATQRDGSERRYTGTYTLQRAVVDGATPEQRAWHLASASLRETGG